MTNYDNNDVIVTKTERGWDFTPVSPKAETQFHGHTFKPETLEEAQKLVFWCSSIGLFVQAPAFTTYYAAPTNRKINKTPTGPRHPVTGHRL